MESRFSHTSVLDAVLSHERTRGDSPAFTLLTSNETVARECSFAEFATGVRTLASGLRKVASPGDRAILMASFGIDYLQAFLACLHEGVIAVPAYPPKRNRNDVRLDAIVSDCRPAIALCDDRDVQVVVDRFPHLRATTVQDLELANEASHGEACSKRAWEADSIAYLQYTSGSTSAPKGVMVRHGNLHANSLSIQRAFGNTQQSVGVLWLPLFHDMGLVSGLQTVFVGYHNILIPTNAFVSKPGIWLRAISDYRGTVSGGPNFAFQHCLDRIPEAECEGLDLSSWEVAYNGAEPIRSGTLDQFKSRFGRNGFRNKTFLPCYGLAESTLFVSGGPHESTAKRLRIERTSLELGNTVQESLGDNNIVELVSSGRPDPDAHLAIVDPTTGTRLIDTSVGEIWIQSPSIAKGYWEDLDATEADFCARITDDNERVYLRTGDLGFVKDGELYVTGRHKDLIIVNGRNVYPQDIESEFESHISSAVPNGTAAFGIEAEGKESVVVVAEISRQLYREVRNGLDRLATEIDAFRQSIWNAMNLHIWEIAFIRPGTFPRTSSGKVQRTSCRESFRRGQLNVSIRAMFKADPEVVPGDGEDEQA